DRFMLKVVLGYPNKEEELEIIKRMANTNGSIKVSNVVSPEDLMRARKVVNDIYIDEKIHHYITDIVFATREPESYNLTDIGDLIEYGASPRASIYLAMAGKAKAFIQGRGYVTPEDIRDIVWDILRHRIILTFEAEAEEVTTVNIIQRIIDTVEVP
ncbi:MAG: MoxR family ATPase, partial [Candidatus Marinimicrobia bacterium]|nr:MoxR family ATPase [Candidatus Neomarinimicrobiota bacterium]